MFRFAGALAEMELNEQELAVISALLLFNPDHLDSTMVSLTVSPVSSFPSERSSLPYEQATVRDALRFD